VLVELVRVVAWLDFLVVLALLTGLGAAVGFVDADLPELALAGVDFVLAGAFFFKYSVCPG